MGELIAEIENNFVEYVILRLTSRQDTEYLGTICGLQDKTIVFEVTESKALKDLASGKNKLYNISFKLNRLHYQLQHYALEFILDHELFVRLIDNSDYRCAKPQQTRKVDAKSNRLK